MTQVQDGPGLPRTSEEVLSMVRGREQPPSWHATFWAIQALTAAAVSTMMLTGWGH